MSDSRASVGDGTPIGPLRRGCGIALVFGGLMLVLINVLLTPMMPYDESDAVVRASTIYLVRMSLSAIDALLPMIGALGVHLAQRDRGGLLGAGAFVSAFVGSCLLVAVEWANVFVLRPLALTDPAALDTLGDSALMLGGFTSAIALFGLGWLALAISAWWTGALDRRASGVAVAGFVLTTALTPIGTLGAIAGSVVLGLGLAWMGLGVWRGTT